MSYQKPPRSSRPTRRGWDAVASWYDGWVGKSGSEHHRKLAIPAILQLLHPQRGEQILDIGAGQGVLAPFIAEQGAHYTGVDVSPKLLQLARQHHGKQGRFLEADACRLNQTPELTAGSFDGVTFLLSIQDINPLEEALQSVSWALKMGGRVAILMTHPCFRIPRQSGWGFDENRKLQYRRIDRYLTPLPIPMKPYTGGSGVTISFHRPLSDYINGLAQVGLYVDHLDEITTYKAGDNTAEQEIPLFAALRARKFGPK
ncbi:MAG: class I SAM-dependent methyltransferase [Anaerolineae bacterium]|jgi:ubiquinone/menaquinone biosynthesis C-methylase UbiE|nr:class I SAM-dependent methyltransferase [Anaerolineae bacterium]